MLGEDIPVVQKPPEGDELPAETQGPLPSPVVRVRSYRRAAAASEGAAEGDSRER